jgi:hypothetical protein
MQNSRDPSLWRSLAVAFGDGVAFGVGMKITQNAARKAGTPAAHDPAPVTERLAEIEKRVAQMERAPMSRAVSGPANLDQQAMDALVHALEARLKEHAGQVERHLAELETRLTLELKALQQEDQAVAADAQAAIEETQNRLDQQVLDARRQADAEMEALREHFIALHREFAGAVAGIVEGQVASQVETSTGKLKESVESMIEERVANHVEASTGKLKETVEFMIEERVAGLREELKAKDREITELRQRVTESDRNVLDIILGMGLLCRQAAGRLGGPVEPEEPQPKAPEPPQEIAKPTDSTESAEASDVPGFAQPKQESGLWRVPLVSSFLITAGLMTAGGWIFLYYL